MVMTEALMLGLIAGGLGGNFLARFFPRFSLGMVGNTIAGIAGGGALGHTLFTLMPILENATSNRLSFAGAIVHVIVGLIGGALVVAIIGSLKSKARTA